MKTNRTETVQSRKGSSVKKRKAEKFLIYQELFTLNQEFEQVLETLERLEQLRMLRPRLRRRFIRACRLTVEETRAWANFELIKILEPVEEKDWGRFGRLNSRLEGSDDVEEEWLKYQGRREGKKRHLEGRAAS